MWDWVVKYWVEFALGLVATGLTALGAYFIKEHKKYKALLKKEEEKKRDEHLDEKINPILSDIEEIRTYLRDLENLDTKKFNIIIASYRYRLCQLCKIYLEKQYMTPMEYEQLNEFYGVYEGLGGNGQAREWYDQVKKLPIHD